MQPAAGFVLAHAVEAAAYATCIADLFRETYAHGYTAERLERHIATHFHEARQREELLDPHRWTLRAGAHDRWDALAMVRTVREAPASVVASRPAEVERFYVAGHAQGSGLAYQLMDALVDRAASAGHDALWLIVWRHNARAKRFYERYGFTQVGHHPFVFDGVPEMDDVYQLAISPRASSRVER
jgi:ribosomal protein S18 acetylase RimI-like enzyme